MSDSTERVAQAVKRKYAGAASQARASAKASCCATTCCGGSDPITEDLYAPAEMSEVPLGAALASLGCGNPIAVAELHQGEIVLDLGSGGGIDVILSARRVGPSGHAYGLDMTDEMLELARDNAREAGVENVEFLRGQIEDVPLPDQAVDVIISNCVINLSLDKDKVLEEAYRVLKPGGRLAVADVVFRGEVPQAFRDHPELWAECVGGALSDTDYRAKLERAGFTEVAVEPVRVYDAETVRSLLESADASDLVDADQLAGSVISAIIRGRKVTSS